METYIDQTVERFANFNSSSGVPFRELVGRLLWVTLCVMGPELLRVKDLARRCNSYTPGDYKHALKVFRRVSDRKHHGLVFTRGSAGKELTPSSSRLLSMNGDTSADDLGFVIEDGQNDLGQKSLCKAGTDPHHDSSDSPFPILRVLPLFVSVYRSIHTIISRFTVTPLLPLERQSKVFLDTLFCLTGPHSIGVRSSRRLWND
jgi:hypothetical protein